ncbi:hypothetical protein V6N12_019694 [Hibiscus sabdariffa]|uniref:Uncharacterized protein n=1 Tax=Hibiscus sabdariffa TaxID=183260 RepID=A0ABR2B525_9ROSI
MLSEVNSMYLHFVIPAGTPLNPCKMQKEEEERGRYDLSGLDRKRKPDVPIPDPPLVYSKEAADIDCV